MKFNSLSSILNRLLALACSLTIILIQGVFTAIFTPSSRPARKREGMTTLYRDMNTHESTPVKQGSAWERM
jgi:hypothetical protein